MASSIDLPLDDVIQAQQKSKQGRGGGAAGGGGGGKGGGTAGGARGGGKGGRGKGAVRRLQGNQMKAPTWRVWGMPPKARGGVGGPGRMATRQGGVAGGQRKAGAVAKDGSKLDMALEEVITKDWTGGKKGGGKGDKDGRTVVRTGGPAYRAPAASGWQKGKGRYVGSKGGSKGGKGGKVGRVTRQSVPWTRTKPGVKFISPRNLAVARGRYFASSAGASKAYLASKDGGYAAARQGKGSAGGERIIRTRAVVSIPPSLRPRPVTVRTKGGKGSSGPEGPLGKGGDRGVAAAVWRKASLRPAWHEHDDREAAGGGGWKSQPQEMGWSKNGRGGAEDERRPLTQQKQWSGKRRVSALVQASQAAAGWKNNWAPPARQFAEDHQRSSWRRELERQPPPMKQRYSWRAEEEDEEEEDDEDEESEDPPPQHRPAGGGQRRRKVQEVEDERPRRYAVKADEREELPAAETTSSRRVYRPAAPREAAQRPSLREPLPRSSRVVRNSVSGTGGGARSAAPAARAASPSPPRRRNQQPQQPQREARQKTAGPASRQQPTSRQRGRAESQYADDPPARGPPQRQAQKRSRYEDDDDDADRRVKRVRVSNIPRDLDPRDIKDAFEEETGKVMSCEVQRGTAWLTYRSSDGAKKAVETFNRGELNGNIIEVSIED